MKHDVTIDILMCAIMGVWVGMFAAWFVDDVRCGVLNTTEIILHSIMLLCLVGLFIFDLYLTISLINKKLNKSDDSKGDDEK